MSALVALLGFQLLVFVHELGHYLVARAVGMRVVRFSIGFGPALAKLTHGETTYVLGVLPFGGLVQVAGLGGTGAGTAVAKEDRRPSDYDQRPLLSRAAMVLAGPVANLLFAALLALIGFLGFKAMRYEGRPLPTLILAEVEGPAKSGGLLPGDAVVAVDGEPVKRLRELNERVGASEGRPLRLSIRRPPPGAVQDVTVIPYDAEAAPGLMVSIPIVGEDWAPMDVTVTPASSSRGFRLGIRPQLARFGVSNPLDALSYAAQGTVDLNKRFLESLARIFRGEEKAEVTGIVKLVSTGADLIGAGLTDFFLDLLILISVNLAILNLLPLPALDGGRLLFLLVEAVARRPVPRRLETWVHGAGFVLFLGLLLVVSGQEIWALVTR